MEIDWSEVAKNLGSRLASSVIELEQWKYVAEKLFEQTEELKSEKSELAAQIKSYEDSAATPTDGDTTDG